ncbi:hypothetical protein ASPWEDRAFT_588663 [Aspergillus wentii DTO 134E9]|uniref:NADH:ubiquinone oxidoreductase intermediate-associated protein 30 domain-containing protein n=1 Tax=Aspergillus wentii DTO 134E9 TaxID=1073089 RepID=A0A1L9RCK2_ASPWE|nr:uncharacterized protein ASPWEDRAFT_588663 [Aspergillus wentii DTO 134E9]KAI9924230.1 hypothetical protein MW887_007180 [Aspergillus wentii]OJJ32646.1 hypothetical protein ASPWEDRAFT_588663 [Aspergillus wentii DTO 134E9]
MASQTSRIDLFGGSKAWSPLDWTSSDDRVRGGSSHSTLTCSPSSPIARFHGNLDITTLGGAGFASQRTRGTDRTWDLSEYDGLELDVDRADGKVYTITLKDEILPKRPDGREQSTLSWEYDFPAEKKERVSIKWADFKATYRGKEKKVKTPLNLTNIKRVSIMMRSFFGTQEGDFSLEVASISAFRTESYRDDPSEKRMSFEATNEKEVDTFENNKNGGLMRSCLGCCF